MPPAIDFDPSRSDPQPGERLGVWRLQRLLAELPSGQWWRAENAMGRQPALVLVYRSPADAGAVLLRMAEADAPAWQHPDVAWPLDSGLMPDGRPYVVMPALDGEPLLAAMGKASLRRRLDWAMQLCELLLLARAKGLALVELDPSLLWLGPQQQLRLHGLALAPADGDAQRLGSLQGQLSSAAQGLHCPAHLRGAPGGAQAQVYSVGMLMCLLVNGRLPHAPAAGGGDAVQALSQWLSLPSSARERLDALLHSAVDPDPARRPADLDGLGQAIENWLGDTDANAGTGAGGLPASAPMPLGVSAPMLLRTSAPMPLRVSAPMPLPVAAPSKMTVPAPVPAPPVTPLPVPPPAPPLAAAPQPRDESPATVPAEAGPPPATRSAPAGLRWPAVLGLLLLVAVAALAALWHARG